MQTHANEYAKKGWRVLPIRAGTKVPPMRSWQHAATTDPATIENWWNGLYRDAGVGIATGQQSGIWVLDIDADHGGIETLRQLVQKHGALPKGSRVDTPSGGFHLYFRNPAGLHVATTKNISGSGIDVRGDGGQVLAPPTIHPNGRPYAWARQHDQTEPDAPEWLLDLVVPARAQEPAPKPKPKPSPSPSPSLATDSGSAAAEITEAYDWHELLTEDGWTLATRQTNGDSQWTRPNKSTSAGVSAILHEPDGPFVNYSTSADDLCQTWAHNSTSDCWSYSLFGYVAATRYDGDRSETARDWARKRTEAQRDDWYASSVKAHQPKPEGAPDAEPEPEPELSWAHLIDWPAFWELDHSAQEWVMWPMVPAGRAVALFAPAKAGKSTVTLAAAAAAACGQPIYGSRQSEPVHVLYLDFEMTEADIWERLIELGYGAESDMSHLHYSLLPSIYPLDTAKGAAQVVELAEAVGARLVVIDTFSRAVEGDENDADTSRGFYRFTGMALKVRGIACLRTDHAGKEVDRGQRGSSAKNDDVDVVWSLERADGGVLLKRTHSRVGWVPEQIELQQVEHDDGRVVYRIADRRQFPEGIEVLAILMDKLQIPMKSSSREAARALREAGEPARNAKILLAQSYREQHAMREWAAPSRPPNTDHRVLRVGGLL